MKILLDFKYVYYQGSCRTNHSLMIQNGIVPQDLHTWIFNKLSLFEVKEWFQENLKASNKLSVAIKVNRGTFRTLSNI